MNIRSHFSGPNPERGRRAFRPTVALLEDRKLLSAGTFDTGFGGTGQVILAPSGAVQLGGLAIQADLKTVVVGLHLNNPGGPAPFNIYDTTIFRSNVDGSLDSSFGSGGQVTLATTSAGKGFHVGSSVALQSDGKIVVATNTMTYTVTPATHHNPATYTITSTRMMVVRLNLDGSLDSSFGNGGQAVIAIPNAFEVTSGVAVLPGGQIVIAGTNLGAEPGPEFLAARLTSSGALDTTFGSNGQGYNDLTIASANGNPANSVDSLGVDASGNILVGGVVSIPVSPYNSYRVVRYTSAGVIDTSFANQGIFDLPERYPTRSVDAIAFQPDGRILLGLAVWITPGATGAAVLRLNTDGTIDTTFGSSGFYVATQSGFASIAVQPDGKVLLASSGPDARGALNDVQVDRLLPGGTLDPAFGTGGKQVFAPPNATTGAPRGLVIGPDGKITGAEPATPAGQPMHIGTFRLLNDIASNSARAAVHPASAAPLIALPPAMLDAVIDRGDLITRSSATPTRPKHA